MFLHLILSAPTGCPLCIKVCSPAPSEWTLPPHCIAPSCAIVCIGVSTMSPRKFLPNRTNPLENENFFDHPLTGQPSPLKMRIFWPLPNFHSVPDFRLKVKVFLNNYGKYLKRTFYKGSKSFNQSFIHPFNCNQPIILIKVKFK